MNKKIQKKTKHIKFDETIYTVLIPSFREMNQDIRNDLWWSKRECRLFCDSAIEEVKSYMKSHEGIHRKHALTALYQPILFRYDPSYFI
uniref:Uncharacterized protein n=1 Tax=viral metagenome TaxID=1070528 RepID=A0A6C0LQ87_9ZZZZ